MDFRARTAASYGHAFVWYGKTSEKQVEVAGLHPAGDTVPYVLGHLMWVPSETGASYGDLDVQYLTASYRVYLSEADAKKVFRLYQASSGDLAVVECGDNQLHCFHRSHSEFYGFESSVPFVEA